MQRRLCNEDYEKKKAGLDTNSGEVGPIVIQCQKHSRHHSVVCYLARTGEVTQQIKQHNHGPHVGSYFLTEKSFRNEIENRKSEIEIGNRKSGIFKIRTWNLQEFCGAILCTKHNL
jgi:hypothetical protein